MKCDLCHREANIVIQRKFINRGIMEGYICKVCYDNFMKYPNRMIYDQVKYWYISDPEKFPDNSKLTFHYSEKAAFREFNPKRRIFKRWNPVLGWIKVSYYFIIKGKERKGPYFWDSGLPDVFKTPREVEKAVKKELERRREAV